MLDVFDQVAEKRTSKCTHISMAQATQIDSGILAELPKPDKDPSFFKIISNNMIHGPCGALNPKSVSYTHLYA